MCSSARAAAAEALAALCEAAGVLGVADPLEQAAIARPAAAVAAVMASQRPGRPRPAWWALMSRRWPSALSLCRTADPPVADHSLLVLAFPAFSG
jgi:hypothetical protein